MDFQLSAEEKIFKQTVHDFAERRIAPMGDVWEKGGPSSIEWDEITVQMQRINIAAAILGRRFNQR